MKNNEGEGWKQNKRKERIKRKDITGTNKCVLSYEPVANIFLEVLWILKVKQVVQLELKCSKISHYKQDQDKFFVP